jgi:hypothetical protein
VSNNKLKQLEDSLVPLSQEWAEELEEEEAEV